MSSVPPAQDRAYSVNQVAEILNVTHWTVYDYLAEGHLKGIRLKKRWRIMRSDLEEFIATRRAAQEEIAANVDAFRD